MASVEEVVREEVLPRRYEWGLDVQEKLRQLYHTKLEQLSVLVSRLATYADVLETHFMGPDVLALTTSGLRAEGDEEFVDVSADRFFRLEKELVRAKAEVNKRTAQLADTFLQIDWLYTELGIPAPYTTDDNSPPGESHPPAEETPLPWDAHRIPQPDFSLQSAESTSDDPFLTSTPTPLHRNSNPLGLPTTTGPGPSLARPRNGKTPLLFTTSAPSPEPAPVDPTETYHRLLARFILTSPTPTTALPSLPALLAPLPGPPPALLSFSTTLLASLTTDRKSVV